MSPEGRPIPWRVVQDLDTRVFSVSQVAADYIDMIWNAPLISMAAIAPMVLVASDNLQKIAFYRACIADILESVTVFIAGDRVRMPLPPSAATGDGPTPSAAKTPMQLATERSEAAAIMRDKLLRAASDILGEAYEFMASSIELLPLSLVVPCATTVGTMDITPRLERTVTALEQMVDADGFGDLVRKSKRRLVFLRQIGVIPEGESAAADGLAPVLEEGPGPEEEDNFDDDLSRDSDDSGSDGDIDDVSKESKTDKLLQRSLSSELDTVSDTKQQDTGLLREFSKEPTASKPAAVETKRSLSGEAQEADRSHGGAAILTPSRSNGHAITGRR